MELICPIAKCRTRTESSAAACPRCGVPLAAYARLLIHPARLFNDALTAARGGDLRRARDLFAAVVYWNPLDVEARNALALACLALGDRAESRRHWDLVLQRCPTDVLAAQGLMALNDDYAEPPARPEQAPVAPLGSTSKKQRRGRRPR